MNLTDIITQRQLAKNGMIVSLGITTLSGLMMRGKTARYLHYTAGAALIGFSIWHHQLYPAAHNECQKRLSKSAQTSA